LFEVRSAHNGHIAEYAAARYEPLSDLKKLIHEIHRRSLWQVVGIYLAASWGALQVVETLVESAGLPPWLPGMAIALLVVGLPVVLATAVVQEGVGSSAAPSVEDAAEGAGEAPLPSALFTWRNALVGGVAAAAVWGVVATVLLLRGGGAAVIEAAAGDSGDLPSIAVLPFENIAGEDNEYFTDGIHEDVITALYKAGGMKVIARTSVMGYREARPSIAQIAEELGVATILEGSVRREGDEVRVTAQLIDGRDEGHIWAESFDRNVADVFAIQGELAREIARQLRSTLAPMADSALDRRPTRSTEAYDLVLRSRTAISPARAAAILEDAVTIDPEYAEAWAALSERRSWSYQLFEDRSDENVDRARYAARRALDLEPDLPEGHLALGYYHYRCHRDYDAALSELARAEALRPGWARALGAEGYVARRAGQGALSLEKLSQAVDVDPQAVSPLRELVLGLTLARRFNEAEQALRRQRELAPLDPAGAFYGWVLALFRGADTEPSLAAIGALDPLVEAWLRVWIGDPSPVDMSRFGRERPVLDNFNFFVPVELMRAVTMFRRGDPGGARAPAEAAVKVLTRAIRADPRDVRAYESRAIAYAALGQREAALEDLDAMTSAAQGDALAEKNAVQSRMGTLALLGDIQGMVEGIEWLVTSEDTGWTVAGWERAVGNFAGFREDPEIVALFDRLRSDGY
jgi:TolB-like protein/Tfp pilus assembly protein PilF